MSSQYYYPPASAPIAMPQKSGYATYPVYQHTSYGNVSASPPEATESFTTGSGVTSYDPSAASSSYAGSASDYDSSSAGTSSIDLLEYMNDRLQGSFNPTPLDRSLVQQTQASGKLNAKTRQLMELQALAQSRLAAAQANFADGIKTARDVQRDLEWTQRRVSSINQRAARKYPKEYAMAQERYPAQAEY